MPAKDIYHNLVKQTLENEGWAITNDPFRLRWGSRDLYIDLGAEQYLAIRQATFRDLFEEPIGKVLLENNRIRLIVFDPQKEVIVKWIS